MVSLVVRILEISWLQKAFMKLMDSLGIFNLGIWRLN